MRTTVVYFPNLQATFDTIDDSDNFGDSESTCDKFQHEEKWEEREREKTKKQ